MRDNILKLLNNKHILFVFFLLSIFIPRIGAPAESQNLKSSTPYQTQVNALKILQLPLSDFTDNAYLNGFMWAPFVLPIENLTVTNAALYVGYRANIENNQESNTQSNDFIPPPTEGKCEIVSSTLNTQKKEYVFVNTTKQKHLNTSIFFIFDKTRTPVAVARLNTKGESRCLLPNQAYIISTGLGRQRYETEINGKSKIVNLSFPAVAALRVTPNKIINVQNGDIIRIGRKINLDFAKNTRTLPKLFIATKLHSDLYVNADMMSHDLAVDEYLKTSFLVGETRFQIELEPGNYVIALLRKNKLICLNNVSLKSDANYDLSCQKTLTQKSKEDIAYQFASEDSLFDVGFRPPSLIRNKNFVYWTLNTPGTILLGPPIDDDATFNPNVLNQDDFFSIVFKKNNSILQTSYGASFSESINIFKLPLIGMHKNQLLDGQVPFSEYVHATSQKYYTPYFLNLTNVVHTNGAEISVLEPIMTSTGNLFATNSQDFLIRITVPRWDTTQILEMYINKKLSKRWILNRGDLSVPFSTTEKVNTYETKNFMVKFVSRGASPLPNFLTGLDSFLPFAETREFCVSLDGKENCS